MTLFVLHLSANTKPTGKLAVIFYLYGGGFRAGSGDDVLHGPDFLIEQDVILVTINFRVHIFGLLSLNTPEYSGNMAFKDQQLGLQWIHENIKYFNGDENQITIMGHSGGDHFNILIGSYHAEIITRNTIFLGAMSANFHVFNDVSNKLFKNIICLSGTAHVFNIFSSKNDYLDDMYTIARNLSYPANNYEEIVAFLKDVPAETLFNLTVDRERITLGPPSYGPIVESM